jgi:hypothetical protein
MSIKKHMVDIELNPNDYIICGTDGCSQVESKQGINIAGMNYFYKCFPGRRFPNHTDQCLCGHYIMENCYITTRDLNYDNIQIIGNYCYSRYVTNLQTNCLLCNNKHDNGIAREKGICNSCTTKTKNEDKIYKTLSRDIYNTFKTECKIIHNAIKLLNKIHKDNIRITFVFKPEYSIANIYNHSNELIYRMNLKTLKSTTTSPNIFLINL